MRDLLPNKPCCPRAKRYPRLSAPARIARLSLILGVLSAQQCTLSAQPNLTPLPTNSWTVTLGQHSESSPSMDTSGNVYVTTTDGKLHALNPDGTRRWSYTFGFSSASTPAIWNDAMIYFGSRNRRLYAVDTSGNLSWSYKTGGWVDASPAIGADGTVYVGSWDSNFYALGAKGQPRWTFATGGPITSSAAIDAGGTIYFGSHDGKCYAVAANGVKQWEFPTRGAILASPAIGSDGALYFTSADGYLRLLNPDGTLRWQLHTGGITAASPVLGIEGNIFVGINSNHCEISAAGKLLWSRSLSPNGYGPYDWLATAPVALENGTVFTVGTDMALSIFERGGRGLWHGFPGSSIRAAPLLDGKGNAYCATVGTGLFAFTNCPAPAASSWPMFRGNPQRTGRVAAAP